MDEAAHRWVTVPAGDAELGGVVAVPPDPSGFVILVTGGESGSESRLERVADRLRRAGFGTFVAGLLRDAEGDYRTRFDVELLTGRIAAVTEWVRNRADAGETSIGYFASGTAAAAAVESAARFDGVRAVVALGGRVDRVAESLPDVRTPTLLVVGGADASVLALNRRAFERLDCEKSLEVVPGAGHRFEGSDELDRVSELAGEWFEDHLRAGEAAV